MNKAGKFLVSVAAVALIGGAATACGDYNDDGVQYVYVHGYYDSHHHYHTYSTPHRVTTKYYNSHKNSYPNPHKTVKVTPPRSSVNKGTGSKVGGGSSYRKSGGSTFKKSGGFSSGRRR